MSDKPHLFWFLGRPAFITPSLFIAVLVTCVGSSLLFGYSMAVLNNLEYRVKCFFLTEMCVLNGNITKETSRKANLLYSGLTAAYIVLGAVGSFSSGFISDLFGRKNALILNNIVGVVGAILSFIVIFTKSTVNIFISRLILGLNAGITSGIAPTFIAEITPTAVRGAVTACHQLSITLGITLAYIITLKVILNRDTIWILSLAIPIIPAIISLIVLPFCPKSPRYLFINKNDEANAKIAFERYNEVQDALSQLTEIKNEAEEEKKLPKFKILDLFFSKLYRLAIIISVVLNIMQQFSGINAIIGYSQSMFKDSKIPDVAIEYCVLGIGILNSVATIPAVMLMEIGGRRPLLIYPTILSIFSLIGCFLTIGILPQAHPSSSPVFAVISVVFICLFIVGFAIGMGPVPGIIVAEMFTQAPRAAAYSLALGIQWCSAFIILLLYPVINGVIRPGFVFLFFIVILIVCLIFLIIVMPETKNRSFADTARELSTDSKVRTKDTA